MEEIREKDIQTKTLTTAKHGSLELTCHRRDHEVERSEIWGWTTTKYTIEDDNF
jgi:hypothetical protein